jgi:NADPH-dependent 2,4-dienoyl-CoA reductase/sulfur reductase-like enzyme
MKAPNHATKSNRHVSRRRFVTNLAAAAAGTAALATQSWAQDAASADELPPGDSADVLVVGGGTAGAIAAIQAARAGAQTMLVEMGGQLGGTTTTGGVAYPGLFHAWGRQVIAGIGCRSRNSARC